ncbi:uncharacterized protein LOC124921671 [Impatiens glandulifera]|uniref:uncharacterized protein LOC124921671 n=1 Tax=Impatiens glandulifera TaxID=253017 RepID=UPI001FB09148|nr:uncharacterized protein LOC124921387 isoform X1 [Impatiens glandulifera]XP_047318314.1 uncharacterized protein LOC124921671 [Impatiens glandulifera]
MYVKYSSQSNSTILDLCYLCSDSSRVCSLPHSSSPSSQTQTRHFNCSNPCLTCFHTISQSNETVEIASSSSGKLIIEDDDDKDDDDEDDDDKDEDDVEDKLYRLIQIPVSIVQIHICLRLSSLGFYMKSILMLISFHAIIFCELCLRDVRHSKEMISSQNLKNTQLTNLFFKYM